MWGANPRFRRLCFFLFPLALSLTFSFALSSPAISDGTPSLVLNEVFYDPSGADAGQEWVELYAPRGSTWSGLSLEFGNGSGPGQWMEVWRAPNPISFDHGDLFVIGAGVPQIDASAKLALQNGPDGLRLLHEGVVLDQVGWGPLAHEEYYEGDPAESVQSGRSLARKLDGVDSGNNLLDFESAAPSPGRANSPERDLAASLSLGSRALPVSMGTRSLWVELTLTNRGRGPLPSDSLRVWLSGREVRLEPTLIGVDAPMLMRVEAALADTGLACLEVRCDLPGDANAENDFAELCLARSPGPLRFHRIHPRPEIGAPEWIELEALESIVTMEGWTIEDQAGGRFHFESGPIDWEPGEIRRIEEDPSAGPDGLAGEGWPSLNDSEDDFGVADSLFLVDSAGRIRAWAAFGALDRGQTWVRVSGSPAPSGLDEWTLETATAAPSPSGRTEAHRFEPTETFVSLRQHPAGLWFALRPSGAYSLRLFDLAGRPIWRRSGNEPSGREVVCRWDGRDSLGGVCPDGTYVLQTHVRPLAGRAFRREQAVVVAR